MKISRLEIRWAFHPWYDCFFPFFYYDWYDERADGRRHFLAPRFRIIVLKGKPCSTRWIYDWYAELGYLFLDMRAKEAK